MHMAVSYAGQHLIGVMLHSKFGIKTLTNVIQYIWLLSLHTECGSAGNLIYPDEIVVLGQPRAVIHILFEVQLQVLKDKE